MTRHELVRTGEGMARLASFHGAERHAFATRDITWHDWVDVFAPQLARHAQRFDARDQSVTVFVEE